jgi:cytochrome c oxidase accessory protein FixG
MKDRIAVQQQEADDPVSLYAERQRIHPKTIYGRFQRLRDLTVWITMGIYLVGPWLRWDGRQAILFDLPERQFHIFGFTFWPQDFVLLSWALIIAAFALFFFTVLAGRVWCGYVCPQTTWTRFFTWIESKLEGDRNARLKMDQAPWTWHKFSRRGSKHALWLALALLTGVTFVGYFSPIADLIYRGLQFQLGGWETFWIGFFTLATYGNAGWMREQVCIYMCPYARFQSVMFDRDTLIVSYDEGRGEPRRRGAKKRDDNTAGDCIDCGLCVQVCPTGIDIRDGLQYECITCAACIDACDDVMDHVGKPRGLIRYTTENALEGGRAHVLRPRLIGYAIVLAIMGIALLTVLWLRVPLDMDVLRDRNQLYRVAPGGQIENSYRLRIMNKSQEAEVYNLSIVGPEGLEWLGKQNVAVDAGEQKTVSVTLAFDPFYHDIETTDIRFRAEARDDDSVSTEQESRFITPGR